MIALANKPLGYELQDQEAIEMLSVALVEVLNRKQAEDTLRQSEERYRTILEGMDDSYYEVDLAGNFTFINDSLNPPLYIIPVTGCYVCFLAPNFAQSLPPLKQKPTSPGRFHYWLSTQQVTTLKLVLSSPPVI